MIFMNMWRKTAVWRFMMNDKIVGKINWPFYRYDIIMPKHEESDLLVWLYLSLVVLYNEQVGKKRESYEPTEINDALQLIKEKFKVLATDELLATIQDSVDKVYLDGVTKELKQETFEFLNTFEGLFSDDVDTCQIFRDRLSGEILPEFGDLSYLDHCAKKDTRNGVLNINMQRRLKRITKNDIIKAKKQYRTYLASNNIDDIIEGNNEFLIDPDEEEEYIIAEDNNPIVEAEPPKTIKLNMMDRIEILDDSETEYYLPITIYFNEDEQELYLDSPFNNKDHNDWLKSKLEIAYNSEMFEKLNEYIDNIKEEYFEKHQETETVNINMDNIVDRAAQMKYFGPTYRALMDMDNKDAKRLLCELDDYLSMKHSSFFNSLRQYLESLTYVIRGWEYSRRKSYDYTGYCRELELAGKNIDVNTTPLMGEKNFSNWKDMKKRADREAEPSLKPDLAEILMTNSNVISCKSMYKEFVEDIFYLFSKTSARSHYRKKGTGRDAFKDIIEKDIDKIYNVTLVFSEIYQLSKKNGE